MNKSELVNEIAQSTNLSKADVERFLNAFQEAIIKTLKSGEKLTLTGFLSAESVHKKASIGRNPRTGDEINIAAKNVIKIKAGKLLSDAVN